MHHENPASNLGRGSTTAIRPRARHPTMLTSAGLGIDFLHEPPF